VTAEQRLPERNQYARLQANLAVWNGCIEEDDKHKNEEEEEQEQV